MGQGQLIPAYILAKVVFNVLINYASYLSFLVASMVTPFFADQYTWGKIVYKNNCGPQPRTVGRHTPETFLKGIQVLLNPVIVEAAEKVALILRAEKYGPESAVESWERNLPIKKMLCQVSLVSGEMRLATKYCTECGLLLSDRADKAIHGVGGSATRGVPLHNIVPLYHVKERMPLQYNLSLRYQSISHDTSFTALGNALRHTYGPFAQKVLEMIRIDHSFGGPSKRSLQLQGLDMKFLNFQSDRIESPMMSSRSREALIDGDNVSEHSSEGDSRLAKTFDHTEDTRALLKSAIVAKSILSVLKAFAGVSEFDRLTKALMSDPQAAEVEDPGRLCITSLIACLQYEINL